MKKLLAIIISAGILLTATACNSGENGENESEYITTPVTTDTTPTTTATTTAPPEPEPEELSEEDLEELTTFLERYFNPYLIRHEEGFTNVNDINLWALILFAQYSGEAAFFRYEPAEISRINDVADWGIRICPNDLEEYLRENFNPNFSIEEFDYRSESNTLGVFWDEEKQAIAHFRAARCGSQHIFEILESYRLTDNYYITVGSYLSDMIMWEMLMETGIDSQDFHAVRELMPEAVNHHIFTFTRNENGVINVISKQVHEMSNDSE